MAIAPQFEAGTQIIQGVAPGKSALLSNISKAGFSLSAQSIKLGLAVKKQHLVAQKYMIDGDVSQHIQKSLFAQMNNPDPAKGMQQFNVGTKAYLDKTLEQIPNELKGIIKRDSLKYINNANLKLQGRVFQQKQQEDLNDFYTQYNIRQNQTSNLGSSAATANDVVLARERTADTHNMIGHALGAGLINGRTAAALESENYRNIYSSEALGTYRDLKTQEERDSYKKQFEKSKSHDGFLSAHDKQIVMNQFNAIDKERVSEHGISRATYKSISDEMKFNAIHGKAIDTKLLSDMQIANPEGFEGLFNEIKTNQVIYSTYAQHMNDSVYNMEAEKQRLDTEEPASFEQSVLNDKVSQLLDKRIKFAKDDPVAFTIQNDAYRNIVNNPDKNKGLNRRELILSFQKSHGYNENQVSALSKAEAYDVVGEIKALPVVSEAGELNQVDEISKYLGQFKPQVAYYAQRDLQRAGLPKGTLYLSRINQSNDPKIKANVANAAIAFSKMNNQDGGMSAYKVALGDISSDDIMKEIYVDHSFSNYAETLYSVNGDTTKDLEERAKLQQILSAQLISKGSDLQSAVRNAGEMLNTGTSYGSHNGHVYMYPTQDVTSGRVFSGIKHLEELASKQILRKPIHVYPHLPNNFKSTHINSLLVDTGYARNTNDHLGIILVDSAGNALKTKDGQTFSFTFKDLADPSSELSTEVDKFIKSSDRKFKERFKIDKRLSDMLTSNLVASLKRE